MTALTRKSIENERQNKPTLIAKDLVAFGVPRSATYEILLRRGVFKWLEVRRRLVLLKDDWKHEVTRSLEAQRALRHGGTDDYFYEGRSADWIRGYRAGLEHCRAEVRELCHSPRWTCPANDRDAARWFQVKHHNDVLQGRLATVVRLTLQLGRLRNKVRALLVESNRPALALNRTEMQALASKEGEAQTKRALAEMMRPQEIPNGALQLYSQGPAGVFSRLFSDFRGLTSR